MTKPIDLASLTDDRLAELIKNHVSKGRARDPLCIEAMAEQSRRKGKGLNFEKSYAIIRAAAAEGRFLSYKDLADESEADWGDVRYRVGRHLWDLVEFADRKDWPMLSAVVVNKPNVATGTMDKKTLKGFVQAARKLGHAVTDDEAFLREQQRKVFAWASAGSSA